MVSSVSVRPGFPSARAAGEGLDGGDGVADRRGLVGHAMHGLLHMPVAHEFPAGVERGLAGRGV